MAAASPTFLAKGCVNVIELDSLKEYAGARWSRICEGVYARLETLLRAKLGPNDLFIRMGDSAYLITMPTTEPDDVSAICMRVAFDLHTSFLGQCDIDQIQVSTVSGGEDDTLLLKRLPQERVQSLSEKAGIADLLGKPVGTADPQSRPDAGVRPAPNINVPAEPVASIKAEHRFTPIWSVLNAAITTYACEPKCIAVPGRPGSVPLAQLTPKERICLDMAMFQAGIAQLAKSQMSGDRFLLAVPISFETLGTPAGRMELLSACRSLSHGYRQYITFVIRDVPPGVAQTRLANMVTVLRPFARSVSASVAPSYRSYSAYDGIGLHAIGFDLREFAPNAPFRQTDAEELAQAARRSSLGTFLSSVREKDTLKFAQDARVQYLSGPAVASTCSEPKGMWRLTWAETLSQPDMEIWI